MYLPSNFNPHPNFGCGIKDICVDDVIYKLISEIGYKKDMMEFMERPPIERNCVIMINDGRRSSRNKKN